MGLLQSVVPSDVREVIDRTAENMAKIHADLAIIGDLVSEQNVLLSGQNRLLSEQNRLLAKVGGIRR
jgi:hypothetical protein